jgi:Zn finger protein HypA/HybF involved in hydrogenase expression
MSLTSILYALATVPMFASRPFLAAFVTSLLARWGGEIPFLKDASVVEALAHGPEWFRSGWTVAILGLFAAAEVVAVKHAEVRAALDEIDVYVKSAVAALVALAVLDRDTAKTIEGIRGAGLIGEGSVAGLVAALTWRVASWRKALFEHIAQIDDHDDVGIQTTLSWIENSWTVGGIVFIVVAPILAVVFAVLTAAALWWLQRRAEQREEDQRVPCAACGTRVLPHATACPSCRTPLAAPRAVGVFGTPRPSPAQDLEVHRYRLTARKRCPVCARRLTKRTVRQECPECHTWTFATRADFERHLARVQSRLPLTLLVCLGFSAIPVVGVIPGVVYYRLTLVSALRGFVPPVRGCLARAVTRVLGFGVLALQPIPVLGALVLPMLCLTAFLVYRRALTGHARAELAAAEAATAPAG